MGQAEGFTFQKRKSGDVVIFHHGRLATTLRGDAATAFLDELGDGSDQELMARATGNYARGNERQHAKSASSSSKPVTFRP